MAKEACKHCAGEKEKHQVSGQSCLAVLLLDSFHDLFRSVVKVNGRGNGQARVFKNLARFLDVGTLEPHDKRQGELHLLAGGHDTIGNGDAVDNATEDVDEDSLDLLVRRENAKGLRDLPDGQSAR